MASVLLILAVLSTGLLAGLYFAFLNTFMPTLGKGSDQEFVTVMRRVNTVILNPWFYAIFAGVIILPAAALFFTDAKLLTGAALACNVISHGITFTANVPLNDRIDAAPVATSEEQTAARTAFEKPWNRLHAIRTLFNLAALVLLALACLAE